MLPPRIVLLIGEDGQSLQLMRSLLSKVGEVIQFEGVTEDICYFEPLVIIFYQNRDTRHDTLHKLKHLRELHPTVPIILCTSSNCPKEAITACPRTADTCFCWPSEQDKLLAKVRRMGSLYNRLATFLKHRLFGRTARPLEPNIHQEYNYGLVVKCFGGLELYLDEKPLLPMNSEVEQALLVRMLLEADKRIIRSRLINGFWPDSHPEAARNSLNVAISHVRSYLKSEIGDNARINFRDNAYFVCTGHALHMEAQQFTHLYKEAKNLEKDGQIAEAINAYQKMAALYRGDFLEHISREISWLESKRSQLRETYLMGLDRLSTLLMKQLRYREAIEAAEKVLKVDICIEQAHCRIMKAYASNGQRNKALRRYQVCQKALASELGVEPMAKTKELYKMIKQGG